MRRLTGVVEGAVILKQHHLAMEVDDLLVHTQQLLPGLHPGRPGDPVLQLLHHSPAISVRSMDSANYKENKNKMTNWTGGRPAG